MLPFRTFAWLAAAIVTSGFGISSATADKLSRIVVVPLTGETSGDLAQIPERLTATLAEAAREMGTDVQVPKGTRKEVTALMDCAAETPKCLQAMLAAYKADALVLGDVQPTDGEATLIVTLTLVRKGQDPASRDYELFGSNANALVDELSAIAPSFFAGEEPPARTSEEETPVVDPVVDPIGPVDKGAGFSLGRAKTSSWLITGGGLAFVGTGVAFLLTASGRQEDVDNAPTATPDDIRRRRDMVDSAERLELIGNGLLIAGGLVAAAGATLIVIQAASKPRDTAPSVTLAPVLWQGSSGFAITVRWRR